MVNAALTAAESPQASRSTPTRSRTCRRPPGGRVTLIDPPVASNSGEARLNYPIDVPNGRDGNAAEPVGHLRLDRRRRLGRSGLEPAGALDHGGHPVGVPRYEATLESETYLLDGEELAPVANRDRWSPVPPRGLPRPGRGSFTKIIRHGTGPSTYSWRPSTRPARTASTAARRRRR